MNWYQFCHIVAVILYIYSKHVTASEYYVSAPNGEPCPPTIDIPCHNLSFYSDDYFTDDTIFYFLEGTHTLQRTLEINDVSNLTLQGLGHIEQGFHDTVMQSTSIIMCSDYIEGGMAFTNSSQVIIKSITLAKCWFENSNNIILFETNVSLCFIDSHNVTLVWVSVQNSSGLGLSLINTFDVSISDSSFAQNQPHLACLSCRGGNIYLHYQDTDYLNVLYKVDIVRSNFTLGLNLRYGFGGGLSIEMEQSQTYKVQFYIDSVVLYGNTGYTGANFNFEVIANTAHYSLIINNTISTYGNALIPSSVVPFSQISSGAGLDLQQSSDNYIDVEIIIENSNFTHNIAQGNGGLLVGWTSNSSGRIEFHNCNIYNNSGRIGSGLFLYVSALFLATSVMPSFYFTNVLFDSNHVTRETTNIQAAAILTLNVFDITFEEVKVYNHNTAGLVGFNTLFVFNGNNQFINNTGIFGGGIALYGASFLLVKEQSNILFTNNHALVVGGGIYVSQVINQNTYIPCFFQILSNNYYYSNARLYFMNNSAEKSGDVLYGGNPDSCSNGYEFDVLFNYTEQTGLSVVSSDPIQVCFCVSETPNCSTKHLHITILPGSIYNVSLAALGSMNGLTTGAVRLTEYSTNVNTINYGLTAQCTNVTYVFNITNASLTTIKVYATLESPIDPLKDPMGKIIEATIEACPIGFKLNSGTCGCRSELSTYDDISCDINTQTLSKEGNLWIGYDNDSNCLIVYQNCPFDYCNQSTIQFTITYPDPQCALNRSGLLCGQCSEGLSLMLGSNQCGQCTDDYLVLIIPFTLVGIALVAFIIALNLTVSIGTINGLIFYANVVKLYEPIFFPNGPIPFLSQFISWINLDLGIETCFYNGMDSCSKTWLQFIFPFYVWFLLILIIIMARYSNKVVRLVGTHVVPVLATMVLLSYTKLIRTVFQSLYFTNIQCYNEIDVALVSYVWYIDATVQYLEGCHLPLFLFSLTVLIILIIPYTCYLLTISLFEGPLSKLKCCQKLSTNMKPFFDAYGGPYKDKCRFWTGFLLLVRVILALVVSLDSKANVSLDVLASVLVVIMFMYFILRGIYRRFQLALLEVSFILNLMLMLHMNTRLSFNNNDRFSKGQISSAVLVIVAFLTFCGIIFYHSWNQLLKSQLQQPITNIRKIFKRSQKPSSSNDVELLSSVPVTSTSVFRRRESLLDYEDDNQYTSSTDYNVFM